MCSNNKIVKVAAPITIKPGETAKVLIFFKNLAVDSVYIFRSLKHKILQELKIYPGYWTIGYQHNFELIVKNKSLFDIELAENDEIAEVLECKRCKGK